jgi:hypothetical protein
MQHIEFKKCLRQQDGSIIITALMIMVILSIIGIYANNIATTESQITTNVETNQMAFYDADAGVQHTLAMIRQQLNNDILINEINLSDSSYDAPTGFSFEVTKVGTWLENDPFYFFESIGYGPHGASFSIDVTFTKTEEVKEEFKIGILSDGDIIINGGPIMEGNLHANGDIEQTGVGTIEGDVSAVGTASVDSVQPTGFGTYSNAAPVDVPLITSDHFNEWRSKAQSEPGNTYASGNYTVSDTGNLSGKIIFVDGDVTIPNTTAGADAIVNATIIATGDVTFRGQSTTESPGGPVGVAVIAGGNIEFNGQGDSHGIFWSNGSFTRNGSSNVNGGVVASSIVTFNGGFTFTHATNINNDNLPTVKIVQLDSWADQGMLQ